MPDASAAAMLGRDTFAKPDAEIAVEGFDALWRDGRVLLAAHAADSGMNIDDINIDLCYLLDRAGAMLVLTARAAGEMVGYLTYIIGPSLEKRGETIAEQKPFYVRHDYRGVGPKLRAKAKEILRERGVNHILMRAGIRADSNRQRALFEREGAKYMGELYYLTLEP
jgi:GNAT superfamily N-acetyltransferase